MVSSLPWAGTGDFPSLDSRLLIMITAHYGSVSGLGAVMNAWRLGLCGVHGSCGVTEVAAATDSRVK
jgi:hypothetical protein